MSDQNNTTTSKSKKSIEEELSDFTSMYKAKICYQRHEWCEEIIHQILERANKLMEYHCFITSFTISESDNAETKNGDNTPFMEIRLSVINPTSRPNGQRLWQDPIKPCVPYDNEVLTMLTESLKKAKVIKFSPKELDRLSSRAVQFDLDIK